LNQLRNQCANGVFKLKNNVDARFLDTKISIITATYNSANTILDTLNSLAGQSFKIIEHIVVDGGSTDGTLDILKGWDKYPLKVVVDKDDGIYDAMNKGIRLATGDVVGILNSDDFYVNSEVLSTVAEKMHLYSVDSVYGDLVYIDKFDKKKVVRSWRSCAYRTDLFEAGWQPPHPTFFVKRDVYEKYGSFDLSFAISADFELMLRFLEKYQITSAYIPEVLVKMRIGGESNKSIRNILVANINSLKAFQKNGIRVNRYTYTLRRIAPKLFNRFKYKFLFVSK
jgi:glycosyltransferase